MISLKVKNLRYAEALHGVDSTNSFVCEVTSLSFSQNKYIERPSSCRVCLLLKPEKKTKTINIPVDTGLVLKSKPGPNPSGYFNFDAVFVVVLFDSPSPPPTHC